MSDMKIVSPILADEVASELMETYLDAEAEAAAVGGDAAKLMVRRLRGKKKLLNTCLMEIASATQRELCHEALREEVRGRRRSRPDLRLV